MIDKRFCLIADNGDRLYPYKKTQISTGRYGYALNKPGEQDRKGAGHYTTDLNEVVRRVVHDGWSVRAKEESSGKKRPREGSFGFNKQAIVRYEISGELEELVRGAKRLPSKVHAPITPVERSKAAFAEDDEHDSAESPVDEKIFREISTRRGQPEFRKQLLAAFQGKCCVTGSELSSVLEAAHIVPYSERPDYSVTNGLLLRSDIHTLFDLDILRIMPSGQVEISQQLKGTEYEQYAGKKVVVEMPKKMSENLRVRYER